MLSNSMMYALVCTYACMHATIDASFVTKRRTDKGNGHDFTLVLIGLKKILVSDLKTWSEVNEESVIRRPTSNSFSRTRCQSQR